VEFLRFWELKELLLVVHKMLQNYWDEVFDAGTRNEKTNPIWRHFTIYEHAAWKYKE